MSSNLIVRIQTSRGTHRFTLDNKATWGDLQKAVENHYSIKSNEQIISRKSPTDPDFIQASSNASLKSLDIKHGDLLYLVLAKNQLDSYVQKQHVEEEKKESNNLDYNNLNNTNDTNNKLPPIKKNKGPSSVTLSTSEWVNNPENKQQDNGPKHVPFHEWIEDRQKKYSNQPWNIDPPKYNYQCVPYKDNISFKELPPNAVVKRQEYRHCDVLSFKDPSPFARFKTNWDNDSQIQRAAYLVGRYEMMENPDPKAAKDGKTLMFANVYALYVPPQKGHARGVKLLKDKNAQNVDKIIAACGLERVGWTITTLPRGGKEYHGDIFMSGDEIFTAARLQDKYKNPNTGFSKFVTLVTHIGTKEAEAFQISDQGVAMINNALIAPSDDPGFMMVNPPPEKFFAPSVINENQEIKAGSKFLPDALLVNVIATKAKTQEHLFTYVHFPSQGTHEHVRKHFEFHKSEPLHQLLSDFELLAYLPNVIEVDFACTIAKLVVNKQKFDDKTEKKLREALKSGGVFI